MSKFVTICALLAGLATPAVSAEQRSFNGTWSVELVTESGVCDAHYRYSLAVQEGRISLASAEDGARVSGRVAPDGTVGLSVSNGTASGAASGRLQAQGGSGTWKVSALCSGRWTARRHATRTAQAE
ncbi:hypothetical protein [Methylobacterium sp. A54F]